MHLKSYVDLLTNALDTGYFNMVAHPDIVNFTGDEALYTKYMKKLADRLKDEQIPIEINVNGFRSCVNYPDRRFVKLGVENGNEFIIGVDAHNPDEYHDLASYKGCIKNGRRFRRKGILEIKIVGVVPLRFFNPKPASALKYPDGW